LIYRSPCYLIIYRSHTLLKMVRFFGPPCTYRIARELLRRMLVAAAGVVDDATRHRMQPLRCGVVDPPQTRSSADEYGNVVTYLAGIAHKSLAKTRRTWLVGCVAQLAERRSLAGELTLSCTRGLQPTGDGDHYVGKPSAIGQTTRPTQPFILSG